MPTIGNHPGERPTTLRDLMILVALGSVPIALAAVAWRAQRDLVVRAIVVSVCLVVPLVVAVLWFVCRLARRREERRHGDLFVIVYMMLSFLAVLAVVFVFLLDRPSSLYLGLALFGLLAYLSSWI